MRIGDTVQLKKNCHFATREMLAQVGKITKVEQTKSFGIQISVLWGNKKVVERMNSNLLVVVR